MRVWVCVCEHVCAHKCVRVCVGVQMPLWSPFLPSFLCGRHRIWDLVLNTLFPPLTTLKLIFCGYDIVLNTGWNLSQIPSTCPANNQKLDLTFHHYWPTLSSELLCLSFSASVPNQKSNLWCMTTCMATRVTMEMSAIVFCLLVLCLVNVRRGCLFVCDLFSWLLTVCFSLSPCVCVFSCYCYNLQVQLSQGPQT